MNSRFLIWLATQLSCHKRHRMMTSFFIYFNRFSDLPSIHESNSASRSILQIIIFPLKNPHSHERAPHVQRTFHRNASCKSKMLCQNMSQTRAGIHVQKTFQHAGNVATPLSRDVYLDVNIFLFCQFQTVDLHNLVQHVGNLFCWWSSCYVCDVPFTCISYQL